jgi:hypothetical protein
MSHNVKPNQRVRIIAVEIAISADEDPAIVADKMSALLTEFGTCCEDGIILDWRYRPYEMFGAGQQDFEQGFGVVASDDPQEGEIF